MTDFLPKNEVQTRIAAFPPRMAISRIAAVPVLSQPFCRVNLG